MPKLSLSRIGLKLGIAGLGSALLLVASGAWAIGPSTTIGTDISTNGNLTVSGNSSLGTVTSGTWNGTAVDVAHGGTGATTVDGAVSALGAATKKYVDDADALKADKVVGATLNDVAVIDALGNFVDSGSNLSEYAKTANLAKVATSGSYADLTVSDGAVAIAKVNGLQTALDDKLNIAGGTMTGVLTLSNIGDPDFDLLRIAPVGDPAGTQFTGTLTNADLTAAQTWTMPDASGAVVLWKLISQPAGSRAVLSDASGRITESAVTGTELGYLSGVTSAVQTQLSGKATKQYVDDQDALKADKVTGGGTNGHLAALDTNGNLTDSGKAASDFATAAQGIEADSAVQPTRTVNGHALSTDVIVSKSDVGLGNVPNSDTSNPANITQDSTHRFVSDTQITDWDGKLSLSGGTMTGALTVGGALRVNGTQMFLDADNVGTPATVGIYAVQGTNTSGILQFEASSRAWQASSDGGSTFGNVVIDNAPQTLQFKSLIDSSLNLIDDGDNTKKLAFQISGISTGTTRVLTVPNASGTLALTSDIPSISGKADKVTAGGTNGHFAGLDVGGNLTDSGKSVSDFATAAQGTKADNALQSEVDTLDSVLARGHSTSRLAALNGGLESSGIDLPPGDPDFDLLRIRPSSSGSSRFTGTLSVADLDGDATWDLPNASGTLALTSQVNGKVSKAGDTMTGDLFMDGGKIGIGKTPIEALDVDGSGSFSGKLALGTLAAADTDAVVCRATSGQFASCIDSFATSGGLTTEVSRLDGRIDTKLSLSGGTMTGDLALAPGDPDFDLLRITPGGAGSDPFSGTLTIADLDATQTWTLPNASGTLALSSNIPSVTGKADKVTGGGTNGHLAALDGTGNLVDSGKLASDFASATQGQLADSALQSGAIGVSVQAHSSALDAVSGTNTGDETAATIITKLGRASATVDGYLSAADWSVFNGKLSSYTETDPQVGALTASKWCVADSSGASVVCDHDAPEPAFTVLTATKGGTGISNVQNGDLLYGDASSWVQLSHGLSSQVLTMNASGFPAWADLPTGSSGATTDLSNLSATAINASLVPGVTDGTLDLGSSSKEWGKLYVSGLAQLDGGIHVGATSVFTVDGSKGDVFSGGNLSFSGHLKAIASATATATGTNCTPANVSGNSTRGTITATCADGGTVTVVFVGSNYQSPPVCVVSPVDANAAKVSAAVTSTTTSMTITVSPVMTGSGSWNYICME